MPTVMIHFIIAVGVILWAMPLSSEQAMEPPPVVEIAVKNTQAGQVRLLVSIANERAPCRPVWVTPRLLRKGSAPVWLDVQVRTASGRNVISGEPIEVVRQEVSPYDMLLLDCGGVSGEVVDFSSPMSEWPFTLRRGEYRVQACVTSQLRTFLIAHAEWATTFRVSKAQSKSREVAIREFTACSAWMSLRVK